MSGKISSSMKWTLEEVNLVSEFVSMFNWFEGNSYIYIHTYSHTYIFIPIFNGAYPVYVLCNLRLTCPYWGPIQFRIMNPCQVGFMLGPNWGDDVFAQLLSWPAFGWEKKIIWEVIFGQSCWYRMILANDACAKEMCWFVVIRVGSIPTHHKSVCGTSLKFFKVQEYSLVTNQSSELIDNT